MAALFIAGQQSGTIQVLHLHTLREVILDSAGKFNLRNSPEVNSIIFNPAV